MSGSATSSSPRTSQRLFARARAGDRSALGVLIERYLPELRRWAHGRLPQWARSAVNTSDLIQDSVARTIPRIGALRVGGRRALSAYLRQTIQNRIRDEHRRIGRRGVPGALADAVVDGRPSPLDELLQHELEERYRRTLPALASSDRELIVGHVELDYTHEQLGCATGRTPHAARMALLRAIRRLAERMRDA